MFMNSMASDGGKVACDVTTDNELNQTIMRELNNTTLFDSGDVVEETFDFLPEPVSDDVPQALLSYFETSRKRAARSEKMIVIELEDSSASQQTEDTANLPEELNMEMMELYKRQVTSDAGKENNHDFPSSRISEETLTHSISVWPDSEDETQTEECMGSKVRDAEEITKKSGEFQREQRENRHSETMKMEEERRQRQRDFLEELEKIKVAEKTFQGEIELKAKTAQGKLEQEFLLQQELISTFQKQVKDQQKIKEEEQQRIKRESEKKREEEEERRREMDRRRKEEELKMKEEEERKKEADRRRKEEERKRKDEEDRIKMDDRRRKEEEWKRKEEEDRKREEDRRRKEEEQKRKEEEDRKREEDRRRKEEEKKRKEEEGRKGEEDRRRKEEERKRKEEERKGEEDRRRKEEEKMEKENRRRKKEEQEKKEEEEKIKDMRRKEEEQKRKKEEEKKKEEDRRTTEQEQKRVDEEKRKIKELRLKEKEKRSQTEKEKRRIAEEGRMKEVEHKRMEGEKRKMEVRTIEKMKQVEQRSKSEDEKMKMKEEIKQEVRLREEDDRRRLQDGKMRIEEEWRTKEEEEKMTEEENGRMEDKEKIKELGLKEEEEKRRRMEEDRRVKDVAKEVIVDEKRVDGKKRSKEDISLKNERGGKMEGGRREIVERRKLKEEENNGEERRVHQSEWNWIQEHMMVMKEKERNMDTIEVEEEQTLKKKNDMRKFEEERKVIDGKLKEEERGNQIGDEKSRGAEERTKEEEPKRTAGEEERKREDGEIRMEDEEREIQAIRIEEKKRKTRDDLGKMEHDNPGEPRRKTDERMETKKEGRTQCEGNEKKRQIDEGEETERQENEMEKKRECGNEEEAETRKQMMAEQRERKRLSWVTDCVSWSKLSQQNRKRQTGRVQSRRAPSTLPPLCPNTLLMSTRCKSLQEVTTLFLEDLTSCSLVTLSQCPQLQSLTLRRCGLISLEGINQLPQLCHVDAQENNISYVDCENMTGLRVLRLGHNKLRSIHGLGGVENLDVLDLSHNSIMQIAGLESMSKLQSLSVDHNHLISTQGLRDVCTLLYLNCSHNHLASVDGVENCALLQTLDLRSNSLTEPPTLNNHVLLRELHLDDNNISWLQGLSVCWLPLLQHLSVAENRITVLPCMSDLVSLEKLDLRFNCMSDLQNVCKGLEGCLFLRELHLTANPLQQERGWRSTLQRAVSGLRSIDGEEEMDPSLPAPAAPQSSLASGSFLVFCQAQLKQTCDLQQQHSRELSDAKFPLEAIKSSCRHYTKTLKLAVDQRFAHEYGDAVESAAHETVAETLDSGSVRAEEFTAALEKTSAKNMSNRSNIDVRQQSLEDESSSSNNTASSSPLEMKLVSSRVRTTAAIVIQQQWRKYRQKCGNCGGPPTAERGGERGGDGEMPETGPSDVDKSAVGKDNAATIIQVHWRSFALRRRLASVLPAVKCADGGEDEPLEEIDVEAFVVDEETLENFWKMPLSDEPPPRLHHIAVEQRLSLQDPLSTTHSQRRKQAWVARTEQVDTPEMRLSPDSTHRRKSASAPLQSTSTHSTLSGLSARSQKLVEDWGFTDSKTALLMLKRAERFGLNKRHRDPKYATAPVEERNRPAPRNRNPMIHVCRPTLGSWPADPVKQDQTRPWIDIRLDRDSERLHFLPEISSMVLDGGRVQLVADPGYSDCLHHASGSRASSASAPTGKEKNDPRRKNFLSNAREVPAPQRAQSLPVKKERISYRDNPVLMSGGWGGGKKRDIVKYK